MVEVEGYYLPDDRRYDRKEHIWAKVEGDLVRVGLDMFGQKAAGVVPLFVGMQHGTIPARRPIGSTVDEYQPIIMHDLEQQLAGELLPEIT